MRMLKNINKTRQNNNLLSVITSEKDNHQQAYREHKRANKTIKLP